MTANQSEVRKKYIEAFNSTMIDIWRERMILLEVYDTGSLQASLTAMALKSDMQGLAAEFTWRFNEYGIYVERGTGREVARGNPGDIGRPKVREAKPWKSRAFYSSVMNLKEFVAASLGLEALGIFSNEFHDPIQGRI